LLYSVNPPVADKLRVEVFKKHNPLFEMQSFENIINKQGHYKKK